MFMSLLQYDSLGLLVLQAVVAVIFAIHGYPKLIKPEALASALGWSPNHVRILGVVEILSGILILLGVWSQIAALALAIIMAGAIYTKITKWKIPFWSQSNTGWEFDALLLACALFFLTNLY